MFTPETVRQIDVRTIRHLAGRRTGVLSADEQRQFDAALREAMLATNDRLDRSLGRFGREGPGFADPELRRSYERTRARLAAQAERTRATFPEVEPGPAPPSATPDVDLTGPDVDLSGDERDDVSLGELEEEVEETSDLLTALERIAAIEQQQLEHHQSQVLRDVRGVFFGGLVSVAVIVAGVAPLVEAEPDQRRLILAWTVAICTAAGVVYAGIRATQSRGDREGDDGSSP